ncbi:MAG: L-2-hydroxyglutarate oxidase [Candidatus Rokuibacteriota bacterium]|nr:MAG: L-2-hydroxyglutarate oxidase [Candidatus Rokubacteria bacterium]
MPQPVDIALVGGGIVGLATALALTESYPRARVAILDKEPRLASHQTGHNSGVIHSGIYYKPGSLKARLCVEGARLMKEFCDAHGIGWEGCGKVIVATDERELPRLQSIYERGSANGLKGLRLLSGAEVAEYEPHCRALRALLVPETGIVDYGQVAEKMAALLQERGAEILTGARVTAIRRHPDGLTLETPKAAVAARYTINCAGLHSDRVAALMGVRPEVRIIPFRGEYYMLRRERRSLVRNLIYPVPDPEFPFLGVHFTRTVHGDVEAGPNAVLAFAREGYRLTTVRAGELLGTLTYAGFWHMARRYWRMGSYELYRSASKAAFVRSLQKLVPEIREPDIERGGAGVRAQAVSPDGSLVDDFKISVTEGAVHVVNAPSPGATASLAIGRHIAALAGETFNLAR